MISPIYTKHFAERFFQRSNDLNDIKKIKRDLKNKMCEHIFDCIVYGSPRRVSVCGYKVIIHFCDVENKLIVQTIY